MNKRIKWLIVVVSIILVWIVLIKLFNKEDDYEGKWIVNREAYQAVELLNRQYQYYPESEGGKRISPVNWIIKSGQCNETPIDIHSENFYDPRDYSICGEVINLSKGTVVELSDCYYSAPFLDSNGAVGCLVKIPSLTNKEYAGLMKSSCFNIRESGVKPCPFTNGDFVRVAS